MVAVIFTSLTSSFQVLIAGDISLDEVNFINNINILLNRFTYG
jgi:hypothetical protein